MYGKTVVTLVAALSLATTADAAAQLCAGFPTNRDQGTIEALGQFADGGESYGARASFHGGSAAMFGGVDFSDAGIGDDGAELYSFGLAVGTRSETDLRFSSCGVAQIRYSESDGASLLQLPVGIGLATDTATGPGSLASVYAIPAVYYSRVDLGGLTDDSFDAGVLGGVVLTLDRVFLGGTVEHVFEDGAEPVFGIRAGIRF